MVKANAAYVPPYGSGATLYIRPYMFGSNSVIGVKPADEYQFRVFVTPVGPYFKGGVKPLTLCVSDLTCGAAWNRTYQSRTELCNESSCDRDSTCERL